MDDKYPKIYYESKTKVFLWIFVFLVIFLGVIIYHEYINTSDSLLTPTFLMGVIISLTITGFVLYFYPVATIEIYSDHFTYKKGNKSLYSSWPDVKHLVAQMDKGLGAGLITSIFIDSINGKTDLIDIRMIKSNVCNKKEDKKLIAEIELLSKKILEYGDLSTLKYTGVPVSEDYKF
ncbi:MAG: hypothetical protein AAB637_00835 [Patescibacteria group bacterium]